MNDAQSMPFVKEAIICPSLDALQTAFFAEQATILLGPPVIPSRLPVMPCSTLGHFASVGSLDLRQSACHAQKWALVPLVHVLVGIHAIVSFDCCYCFQQGQ